MVWDIVSSWYGCPLFKALDISIRITSGLNTGRGNAFRGLGTVW